MTSLTLSYGTKVCTDGDGWLKRTTATLGFWWQRHHQRRQLALLDEWQLKDIGIGRDEALRESRKPFWKD